MMLARSLPTLWSVWGAVWVLAGAWLLRAGVAGWPRIPQAIRLAGGLLAVCIAWLAVAQARVMGINFLLSVLVLVWVADIAAYFAGRAFGLKFTRSKLAPSISPGKSWEGVIGAYCGVTVYGVVIANSPIGSQFGGYALLPAIWVLTGLSVVGDLLESLFKRQAGLKDSSNLLPGHGGILDRIDSQLAVLPVSAALLTLAHLF